MNTNYAEEEEIKHLTLVTECALDTFIRRKLGCIWITFPGLTSVSPVALAGPLGHNLPDLLWLVLDN